ncbi:methyltransferase domain-containing protein [Xylophilus rhododendri]|uniref:Methyltransferase domain-containing protein n=1 Tax=Xylophilus rhododendri TaxID=2697032 RepID=A0A857J0A0_9BURK|nr:class I SAM-dependent methyltransferase [Xylophilus rhododendri]QHI97290.1 methyltransferase domain-containing protein [Xylophilus rhododendri]
MHSGPDAPSEWILRWSPLVPPGARLLDLACGAGRHLRWFAGRGVQTLGVDRSPEAVQAAQACGEGLLADLENAPWPLPGRRFDAVVVTNYLHRPLLPRIVESLAPGGLLLYETFALGQETVGRPSRPEFLLRPGELLGACQGLHVLAYEDGWLPAPRRVQRIAALAISDFVPKNTGPLHPHG